MSVVINTLNRCDYLRRTLLALREQTYEAFEVIVVNGPSIDGTADMLRTLPGVRTASCPDACIGRSRNVGVAEADGEIVAFVDDDAVPREDWLEQLVALYDDPLVAGAGGPVYDIPLGAIDWELCTCTRLGVPDTHSSGPIDRYLGVGADPLAYLPGCNMSFRREVLREVDGFNALLSHIYDDVEVCSRIIDRGYRLNVADEALVSHHRAPNAARDEQHELTDPYPVLFCRAVFALQCNRPVRSQQEIIATLRGASESILGTAPNAVFAGRARAALEDGLKVGSGPRPAINLPPPAGSVFRHYGWREGLEPVPPLTEDPLAPLTGSADFEPADIDETVDGR